MKNELSPLGGQQNQAKRVDKKKRAAVNSGPLLSTLRLVESLRPVVDSELPI